MTNQATTDKLLEMKLRAMSDAFILQMNDPQMQDVPFEDRFGILVDAEYTNRKNNGLKRLIKRAAFDQPEAHISAIDYTSGRKLNRNLIERLATCEYIAEYRNVFITGATGSGKTYMACALGLEACKQRFTTRKRGKLPWPFSADYIRQYLDDHFRFYDNIIIAKEENAFVTAYDEKFEYNIEKEGAANGKTED